MAWTWRWPLRLKYWMQKDAPSRPGSAYLFGVALELGVIGVWIAMGMDWLARSIAFAARYRQKAWQTVGAIV